MYLQSMDISIRHPRFYAIYFIQNHIFQKNNCEVISKRILIIFAKEEAEIFIDYLFILAWFSVRLLLFSYDLKTIFVFWRQICYIFNKNKIGKINIFKSPENKNHADKN